MIKMALISFVVGILFTLVIQMWLAKIQLMKNEKEWVKEIEMMKKEAASYRNDEEVVYEFEKN